MDIYDNTDLARREFWENGELESFIYTWRLYFLGGEKIFGHYPISPLQTESRHWRKLGAQPPERACKRPRVRPKSKLLQSL